MRKTTLRLALLGFALAMPAYAQNATDRSATDNRSGTTTPAVTIDSGTRTSEAPVPGANSFTEGQARSRIEAAGFTGIDNLQKDDQGIWRGRAQQNGRQVAVSLDYQGNVSAQ